MSFAVRAAMRAPPSAGFKHVPMSCISEMHFWDLFHRLALSTTDPSKWKAVLKYMDQYNGNNKYIPETHSIQREQKIQPGNSKAHQRQGTSDWKVTHLRESSGSITDLAANSLLKQPRSAISRRETCENAVEWITSTSEHQSSSSIIPHMGVSQIGGP